MSLLHEMYSPKALSPSTELALPIGPNDMVLTVIDASVLPAGPNVLTLGDDETAETVLYSAVDGNTVTVAERGFDGTTAKDWPAGTPVARLLTAQDIAALQDNVRDLAGRSSDGKRVARFTVGTSVAGWTAVDCDYLCDGTDDQVEINAALNALPAHGGEVVILDGTYNIAAPVSLPKDNVTLRGNGVATVLKRMFNGDPQQGYPTGVVEILGRKGCMVTDLAIDGNMEVFDRGRLCGILLDNSQDSTICNSTIYANRGQGVCQFSSPDSKLVQNTVRNNYTHAIYVAESPRTMISGNTMSDNVAGIILFGSSLSVITGNTALNHNWVGIKVDTSSGCTVTGNTVAANSEGITLGFSTNTTVSGNAAIDNEIGLSMYDSSRNTVVSNTFIRGDGKPEDYDRPFIGTVWLDDCDYNLVALNNCMGKAPVVEGGTGNSVYGNKHDAGDDLP